MRAKYHSNQQQKWYLQNLVRRKINVSDILHTSFDGAKLLRF